MEIIDTINKMRLINIREYFCEIGKRTGLLLSRVEGEFSNNTEDLYGWKEKKQEEKQNINNFECPVPDEYIKDAIMCVCKKIFKYGFKIHKLRMYSAITGFEAQID